MRCSILFGLSLSAAMLAASPRLAAELDIDVSGPDGQPAANTVLLAYRLDGPAGAIDSTPASVTIAQQEQMFAPPVSVARVGTEVRFPNFDRMRHHVYSFSDTKRFELRLYSGESVPSIVFDRAGIVVLGCNIHDWMTAYLLVSDADYSAVTDAAGGVWFADATPGRYRIEAWHPAMSAPVAIAEVDSTAGGPISVSLPTAPVPIDQARPRNDPLTALFEAPPGVR